MSSPHRKGLSAGVADRTSTGHLVRRLLRERMRGYFAPVLGALVCMAVVAGATAGTAWLIEPALDRIFLARDRETLYLIPVAILALALAGGGAFYLQSVLVAWVGERIVADFRRDMYVSLMPADLGFFVNTQTGNLIARFTSDAAMLRFSLLRALTGAARHGLQLAALVGVMVYQEWLLALIAIVVFPVATWPIVWIGRRIRRAASLTQARMADLTIRLDESFPAIRLIKAYRTERAEIARAETVIEQVFKRSYRASRIGAITRPVMEALGGVLIAAVILVGGSMVIDGSMTTGEFSSFLAALLLAYRPLKALAGLNNILQEGLAAAQRVFAVLDIEPDIVDAPGARTLAVAGGEIRFDEVGFSYNPGPRALVGIDLVAPAGHDRRAGGSVRRGKIDPAQPDPALLRRR